MNYTSVPSYFIIISAGSVLIAILIDALIGDPHKKWHPVNVIGIALNYFKQKMRRGQVRKDKAIGVLLIFIVWGIIGGVFMILQVIFWNLLGIWDLTLQDGSVVQVFYTTIYIVVMGFGLKWTFAIRNLGDETGRRQSPTAGSRRC